MIEFSVVIVSYKNLDILIDCLNSITQFNDIGDKLEVIVVDNSGDDYIVDYIKSNYGWVNCIKNDNKGFGEANNVGAKVAKGKYLLFLNPDTILVEPIFKFAINKFENNQRLSLFGVKLVDINLNSNFSFYYLPKIRLFSSIRIKLANRFNLFSNRNMYISGANLFVRKVDFFECGMFDENIFMYYEEPDIINRIKKLNKHINFYKQKKIIHLEGKTTNNNDLSFTRRIESKIYYCNKNDLNVKKYLKNELNNLMLKRILYFLFQKEQHKYLHIQTKILKDFLANYK
jgi:GT2 family glycosyltransferase